MMVTPVNAKNLTTARGACFECGGTGHYKATCLRLNRAPRQGGNRQNQPMVIKGGQDCGNNGNQARGGAFMMGAEEARQDPNIMTGTFTLNNHYATTLFDFGADYSFISTTFIPLLDIEPNDLSFSFEIEIASGQLVEINKVIRDCKLEIEGHTFDIGLIPFRHESFDVIVGMDWLSRHKAKIICYKKVVRIPLPHGKILRVLGEKPEEKVRYLMSAKTKEQKLKDIVVVRNFPEVFPDDLSGLPPTREFEFRIDLIPRAMPVVKSPHRLAHAEWRSCQVNSENSRTRVLFDQVHRREEHRIRPMFGVSNRFEAFKILKDKLCNAFVLALPDGPEDFIVYCDASGLGLGCVLMHRDKVIVYVSIQLKIHENNYTTHDLELGAIVFALKMGIHYLYVTKSIIYIDHKSLQYIFNQNELNMRQRCWIEIFSDYDCEIRNHPCKPNVVADALSRKEWVKPKRVRSMNMTIQSSIKDRILAAQNEAFEFFDAPAKMLRGLDKQMKCRSDGACTYGRKSRSPILWAEVEEGQFIRAEIVQGTTENISQIKDGLKAARDRQKSYADKRRKPLEFSVGDHVLLKVSPWKGVVRFRKKGKLAPRFVGPFEITERIGPVAYRLRLPQELNDVLDTFHVASGNPRKGIQETEAE
nr:putative reverse transcriptase domain-containing protein [Tanacetum cinerariifolium]